MYVGVSSQRLAISEIGVSFPDDTFGEESRFGVPFTVCQFAVAHHTCLQTVLSSAVFVEGHLAV